MQPEETRPLRIAIYARVSTLDQDCELQLGELRRDVARRDWPKATEFVDRGFSGAKASRPALDRLMGSLSDYDVVLVWKLDRFGRSVLNLSQQLNELEKAGVRFIAISQGLDTDKSNPASRLLLTILAAIAEFERELIRERSTAGRMKKLNADQPDAWQLSYGHKLNKGVPEIEEDEAAHLRQAFELRRAGNSLYRMIPLLTEAGAKPRRSDKWNATSIRNMLTDRQAIGEYRRCGKVFPIPPIVSREVFTEVQNAMQTLYAKHVGRPDSKRQYLLRSMAWCRVNGCNHRLIGAANNGYRYYRCSHIERRPPAHPLCPAGQTRADVLEQAVWNATWKLLKDPAYFRSIAEAMAAEEEAKTAKPKGQDPREELKAGRARETRLLDMIEDGLITPEAGRVKIAALRKRLATLELEVRAIQKIVEIAPLSIVERALRKFAEGPEPEGYQDRRDILEAIPDFHVAVDGDNVRITGRLPVDEEPSAKGGNNITRPGTNRKYCSNHLAGLDKTVNTFEPIPFVINVRLAA